MDHKEGAYKVADLSLADQGRLRIEWAESRMPVLMRLRDEYSQTQPFAGYKITGCLHVTKETAVLIETLKACGAEVAWSGCNPLSTNDSVAAALALGPKGDGDGVEIYAWYGQDTEAFYWCIDRTIDKTPHTTLDDGADLIFRVHSAHPDKIADIVGGSEETTTGVHRLRAMAADGKLGYPVYAVNDAETKWDFDNVYGTGQSTLDGILRASSILLAGKNFVVAGYGHCGRGVAMRAKGMGANVIVTEVKPTAALKATLDGMRVMPMEEAARVGDVFVTATGMKDVIRGEHFLSMKEGAVVCNTGHYDVELNLKELAEVSTDARMVRPDNREYTMENGKRVYVLADGRLVNLAAAEGHPSEVMDMSFANQFQAHLRLIEAHKRGEAMENTVLDLPEELDQEIARIKLDTMGLAIDTLTDEQVTYATDYSAGT
jgi:adenosylhomocysteinase